MLEERLEAANRLRTKKDEIAYELNLWEKEITYKRALAYTPCH